MARTDDITHFLTDVAAAIKIKLRDNTDIPASNFDTAILNIESTGTYQVKSIAINTNTTTTVTPDVGYDAIEQLTITTNIPTAILQDKSYVFNTNQSVTLLPDTGYNGFNSIGVTVNVPSGGKSLLPDGIKFQGSTCPEIDLSQFDTSDITSTSFMFANCINLINVNLADLNTSNVTNMAGMLWNCFNLTNINLTTFDTSNVTNMGHMFYDCQNLRNIDLTAFNTSNVTNMSAMFLNCINLTDVNLTTFDTSNVTTMTYMFNNCVNLTNIDLTSFNTNNVTNIANLFRDCTSLTTIIGIENMNLSSLAVFSQNIFNNCHNLSNETLNRVLSALSTVTYSSARRSLSRQGLTQEQAEICVNLSNWVLCSTNHWTTGY